MNFVKHSNWEGKHAILSPSKWQWINYDEEALLKSIVASYAPTVGTILHKYAEERIRSEYKMQKSDKKNVMFELLRNKVPKFVVNELDMDIIFPNLYNYVNDCIGYGMTPETEMGLSDYAFGTTDCIKFSEKDNVLRIFDLKTGKLPVHIEQLLAYTAYFCLEYRKKPYEFVTELRFYWNNEIIFHNPTPEEIVPWMDKIVSHNNFITRLYKQEG